MSSFVNILISGGSGGIGLAIVKACSELAGVKQITATYLTNPPAFSAQNLTWKQADLTQESQVKALAQEVSSIDLLVNAAGLLHNSEHQPEKTLKQFDVDFFYQNMSVNLLTSILLAKYVQPKLKAGHTTFFVSVSAKVGSLSDNRLGGWLSYRTSKAALNMAMKTIALEWRRTVPNCCVMLFHPGTTDTPLSEPFQKNLPEGQLHSPDLTAQALMALIKKLTPEDSGRFFSYNGEEIPW